MDRDEQKGGSLPRTLADDLLLVTIVGNADDPDEKLLEFEQCIQSTLDYVKDIRGRVAVGKCILLATMARHRRSLRLRQWGTGSTMSVRHHMRDLGGTPHVERL